MGGSRAPRRRRAERLDVLCRYIQPFCSSTPWSARTSHRSEEHTSELQSQSNLVCRLLLEKKKKTHRYWHTRLPSGSDPLTRSTRTLHPHIPARITILAVLCADHLYTLTHPERDYMLTPT